MTELETACEVTEQSEAPGEKARAKEVGRAEGKAEAVLGELDVRTFDDPREALGGCGVVATPEVIHP